MDTVDLGLGLGEVHCLWGMCLMYDIENKKAVWRHPVDAREGLLERKDEETGAVIPAALSAVIPPGTKVPPHPNPVAKQPGPVVPAVNERAGTVAASAPSQAIGATTPGPRVQRAPAAGGEHGS